jgi:hypothetical protein
VASRLHPSFFTNNTSVEQLHSVLVFNMTTPTMDQSFRLAQAIGKLPDLFADLPAEILNMPGLPRPPQAQVLSPFHKFFHAVTGFPST